MHPEPYYPTTTPSLGPLNKEDVFTLTQSLVKVMYTDRNFHPFFHTLGSLNIFKTPTNLTPDQQRDHWLAIWGDILRTIDGVQDEER